MKAQRIRGLREILALTLFAAAPAFAAWPGDPAKCKKDAVKAGSVCMDKYEASVWEVPLATTLNKGLVKKIQNGIVKLADLTSGGAIQRGLNNTDDYPCNDNGQDCKDKIFAVSIADTTTPVKPSTRITWFQAQAACGNSRKRLPSNAEWQLAVQGTPDPGPDNGTTDCNTSSVLTTVATGSRSSCVSAWGAYDMVGNLEEWVADWVPLSTGSGSWGAGISPTGDTQDLVGAATSGEPGALLRGGYFADGSDAGPLSIYGKQPPSFGSNAEGFRCAR